MTTLYILFISVTIITLVLFYLGIEKQKGPLLFLIVWALLMSALAEFGIFENTNTIPPRLIFIILPAIIYVIYLYRKIKDVNLNYLTALHSIRVPVEIGLFLMFLYGSIPQSMTFEGWNFDIIMGITSLLIIAYIGITKNSTSPKLLYYWNILGLVLLTIIVVTAVLSAPTPFQQLAFDQPNVAIKGLPFLLLPIVIVPVVVLSHLLALRKLKTQL